MGKSIMAEYYEKEVDFYRGKIEWDTSQIDYYNEMLRWERKRYGFDTIEMKQYKKERAYHYRSRRKNKVKMEKAMELLEKYSA